MSFETYLGLKWSDQPKIVCCREEMSISVKNSKNSQILPILGCCHIFRVKK